MKDDVQEKTKCRLIQKDKQEKKQYTKKCESNTTKDVDAKCVLYKTEGGNQRAHNSMPERKSIGYNRII